MFRDVSVSLGLAVLSGVALLLTFLRDLARVDRKDRRAWRTTFTIGIVLLAVNGSVEIGRQLKERLRHREETSAREAAARDRAALLVLYREAAEAAGKAAAVLPYTSGAAADAVRTNLNEMRRALESATVVGAGDVTSERDVKALQQARSELASAVERLRDSTTAASLEALANGFRGAAGSLSSPPSPSPTMPETTDRPQPPGRNKADASTGSSLMPTVSAPAPAPSEPPSAAAAATRSAPARSAIYFFARKEQGQRLVIDEPAAEEIAVPNGTLKLRGRYRPGTADRVFAAWYPQADDIRWLRVLGSAPISKDGQWVLEAQIPDGRYAYLLLLAANEAIEKKVRAAQDDFTEAIKHFGGADASLLAQIMPKPLMTKR